MFNAVALNTVFLVGAAALCLEMFVLLAAVCSRGTDAHRLAKTIYAFLGASVSFLVDISFKYSPGLAYLLEGYGRPDPLALFIVIGIVGVIWYLCIAFAEYVLLPTRNNSYVEAFVAASLAGVLAIAGRALFATNLLSKSDQDPPIFLGLVVSAGVLFASLLYLANKLLRHSTRSEDAAKQ